MINEHERHAGETESEYRARVEAAFKAGKRIECRTPWHPSWVECAMPSWLWTEGVSYRIAPGQQEPAKQEPAKAREWWICPPSNAYRDDGRVRADEVKNSAWVHVREVLPGDDVEALRAERDAAIQARDNALSAVRDMRLELNGAIESRDKMEVALRDMRAELDKVNSERDEYRNDLLESNRFRDKLRNELNVAEAVIRISSRTIDELKAAKESTWHIHEMHGKAVLDLISAQSRIIALQDELAVVRNECATLSAKLTETAKEPDLFEGAPDWANWYFETETCGRRWSANRPLDCGDCWQVNGIFSAVPFNYRATLRQRVRK